jgi:hypothetical protein
MVTLYKIVIWIAGALFLLSMASLGSLFETYTREMPQHAEVDSRRTVQLKVLYGKTVYVTRAEQYRLYAGYGLVALAGGACVAADRLRKRALRGSKKHRQG